MQGQNCSALETARLGFLVPVLSYFLFFCLFLWFGGLVGFFNSLVITNPFLGTFWLPDSCVINQQIKKAREWLSEGNTLGTNSGAGCEGL